MNGEERCSHHKILNLMLALLHFIQKWQHQLRIFDVAMGGRHQDEVECSKIGDKGCKNSSIGEGHGHNGLNVDVGEDEEEEDEKQVGIKDEQE